MNKWLIISVLLFVGVIILISSVEYRDSLGKELKPCKYENGGVSTTELCEYVINDFWTISGINIGIACVMAGFVLFLFNLAVFISDR